ncbi:MAG: serine hydroxymethyltransferase [Planctomycetota bacterium]
MDTTEISSAIRDIIAAQDPDAARILAAETDRQAHTLELIASENHASEAVMLAAGTPFTNKYAEGYPGRRYYGGCAHHDEIESLAIERATALFGCRFANVQPHSGAQANAAVFLALLEPGDTFASLVLADGGHLSHGMKLNMSGAWFKPVHYPLHYGADHPEFERIDYDAVREVCLREKPKLIMCGYSAYPRVIDFERFRAIADECGALLHADIAHIAGLVAAGEHPSPFPHCHVVTTTTHKTLRGPRGGLILTNDEDLAKRFNRAVFPGMQGGPLMHIVFAKAIAFGEALRPEFKTYQHQVRTNAAHLANELISRGYRITSGGTDNHLMLVDLQPKEQALGTELTGADAEAWLESAGIICNKNGVPQDPRPPKSTSGIRLGAPAITTRGLREPEVTRVAELIDRVLSAGGDATAAEGVRAEVRELCDAFPLHGHRTAAGV